MIQGRSENFECFLAMEPQCIFMTGGDPTGTGRGGASIYGQTFADEINADLKHTGYFIILISLKILIISNE